MADETKQAPVPPCSCIQRTGGFWIQGCSCENSGCLADAQAWCTEQNMTEAQHREKQAPVPVGWVRLTTEAGYSPVGPVDAWRYSIRPDCTVAAWFMGDPGGCEDPWIVTESPAEVAALIDAAQRAQRRFDALPGMAARLLPYVSEAIDYNEGTDVPLLAGFVGIGTSERRDIAGECGRMVYDFASVVLDAIEAREAGR